MEPEAGPSAPAARGQVSVARWREDAVLTDRQVLDRLLQEVQRTRRNNAEFAKAQERMEQRLLDAEDRLAAALRVMERWEQRAGATLDRLRPLEQRLRPEGETESGSEDAPTGGPAEELAEESEIGPEDWEDDEDDLVEAMRSVRQGQESVMPRAMLLIDMTVRYRFPSTRCASGECTASSRLWRVRFVGYYRRCI